MDVHQTTISVAVRDSTGKLVMESILETKASTILDFIRVLGGSLWVTFEEETSAAWLCDLLKPHRRPAEPGHPDAGCEFRQIRHGLRGYLEWLFREVYTHGGYRPP